MQKREGTAGCDGECRTTAKTPTAGAGSPLPGRPIEVSIGALDQRVAGVFAVRLVEAMQRRQRATWRKFEDRATTVALAGMKAPPATVTPYKFPLLSCTNPLGAMPSVQLLRAQKL